VEMVHGHVCRTSSFVSATSCASFLTVLPMRKVPNGVECRKHFGYTFLLLKGTGGVQSALCSYWAFMDTQFIAVKEGKKCLFRHIAS